MEIINDIDIAIKYLKDNKIIAYPTDTVYGLACIMNYDALNNLKNRKNRPNDKSLPIMVSDINMMENIAQISERERKVINYFMPGPMTIILDKKDCVESWVNDGKDTLAIRIAGDDRLRKIIDGIGVPIFLTSANFSSEPVCETLEEIKDRNLCDAGFEGKPLKERASTIVRIEDEIKIYREGPISFEDIKKLLD